MKLLQVFCLFLISLFCVFSVASAQTQQNEGIKVGFVAPLTGSFAEWGDSLRNGMELAVQHTKHKFSVSYQDDACEITKALSIGQRLIEIENIRLIIGPGCQGGIEALGPLSETRGVLFFSTGLLDDTVFKRYKNALNFSTQVSMEAQHLAKYLGSQSIKSIGIIHGTNVFGEEFGKRLPELLAGYHIKVVANEGTALDSVDFSSVILRVMQTKPDAIFVHQGETQIGIIAKQLRHNGSKIPFFSYYGSQAQSVVATAGVALEGMKYTYPVNSAESSEEKKSFDREYREQFKSKSPTASSYFIYDGMMILDHALDMCPSSDVGCIRKFFQSSEGYNGIAGFVRFEKDGSTTRPFGIKQFMNGQFEWVVKSL